MKPLTSRKKYMKKIRTSKGSNGRHHHQNNPDKFFIIKIIQADIGKNQLFNLKKKKIIVQFFCIFYLGHKHK